MAKISNEINRNSVLFLYEGETEAEFYQKIFTEYVPPRKIRRNYSNLKGVYSLNDKVRSRIDSYLLNGSFDDRKNIHVFVAYDREGTKNTETLLNIDQIKTEYINPSSRISSINEIVATQDLESWFFHDLEGIYKFLRVPNAKRNYSQYNNIEATNNRILSALFHRFDKHYQKGRKVHGFIDHLDIEKIFNNVQELKESVTLITKLCK
jgi:hypothetical protein